MTIQLNPECNVVIQPNGDIQIEPCKGESLYLNRDEFARLAVLRHKAMNDN